MKVLVISESEDLKSRIEKHLASSGTEIIHYRHPIKAMDNLEELAPEAVLFSANDFPRHWKIFLVFLRSYVPKESVPFVILHGKDFDYDEVSKATFLGVNGMIDESFQTEGEMQKLKDILVRYKKIMVEKKHESEGLNHPGPDDRVDLIFLHPENLNLVKGKVTALSASEIHFCPGDSDSIMTLEKNTLLSECSLRIGEKIYQVDLELTSISDEYVFRFLQPMQELNTHISSFAS